jgi:hypothetical protein
MKSIFDGTNAKEGVKGGESKPNVSPLPGLTDTHVNPQPMTEAQIAQLVRINANKFPKV